MILVFRTSIPEVSTNMEQTGTKTNIEHKNTRERQVHIRTVHTYSNKHHRATQQDLTDSVLVLRW